MNVLVINCGSSSLKFQLMNPENGNVKGVGLVDRIGIPNSKLEFEAPGKPEVEIKEDIENHTVAIQLVLDTLVDKEHGVIESLDEIYAIGHRVVHGGERFSSSVVIDDAVMDALRENIELAPLHNPANIMGIEACQELMPGKPQVGVFDTAFHQTMEPQNYIYALPYRLYEEYGVRRYGFHGTSHKYVSKRAGEMMGKENPNVITCHLGNGGSIAAVKEGKVVDTSMGLTPLEGIIMGTRCGDIDPAILPFVGKKENLDLDELDHIMNKESGVLGISGVSSDFRDIEEAAEAGNERAKLALDAFANSVARYIGAYMTQMDKIDGIVFTAGIGENSPTSRQDIADRLKIFGVELDQEQNSKRGEDLFINSEESSIKVMVIPTDEEYMIAKDTYELTK